MAARSESIDIEPATGPEASWVMPLKVPSGRVYAFYTYNEDDLREVPNVASLSIRKRVDTLGAYVFKYSDDNGRTWSKERYAMPVPAFGFDRTNNFEARHSSSGASASPSFTGMLPILAWRRWASGVSRVCW